MFSSTARLTGWRLAGIVAGVVAFVAASAGVGSAATFGTPYQIGLDPNTPMPITAAGFATTGSCDGVVPPWLDGWHFDVPGGATLIVSLDLVFNGPSATSSPTPTPTPTTTATATATATATTTATATPTATATGLRQPFSAQTGSPFSVIYTMDREGAYVATLPGAQLVSAAAMVVTLSGQAQAQFLELANTCPASTAFSFPTFTPAANGQTFSPASSSLLPTGQDTPIPATVPLVGTGAVNQASASPSPTCTPASDPPATTSTTPTPDPTTGSSTDPPSADAVAAATTTATATATVTATATATTTATASATPTASASATPTASATVSATPSATATSGCGAAPAPSAVSGNLPVTG